MLSVFKMYHLVSIVGPRSIQYSELDSQGQIKHSYHVNSEGRIISFQDDVSYNTGLLYMMDKETVFSFAYENRGGCNMFVFPYAPVNKGKLTLCALKMETTYKLLSVQCDTIGQEVYKDCLTYDSSYNVMSANKAVFMKLRKTFGVDTSEIADEIEEAFKRKEFCNVVVITSPSNGKSYMFPFIKERDPINNTISDMRLVTSNGKYKALDHGKTLDLDATPFHSFYITEEEFGPNIDSYCEVSDTKIRIYDKQLELK